MVFKIVRVDMDGFLGRDRHPQPSDVGKLVTPIAMSTMTHDDAEVLRDCGFLNGEKLTPEGEAAAKAELEDRADVYLVRCWRCVDADGRELDLMDFEVELFRS